MRITKHLREIEQLAAILRERNGDTQWSGQDRDIVTTIHVQLAAILERSLEQTLEQPEPRLFPWNNPLEHLGTTLEQRSV